MRLLSVQIEEQMLVLSSQYRMPEAMIETQLSFSQTLEKVFQKTFPSCMLVPFGATISGYGTVTSDCDLCLLSQPTEQDQRYLSGEAYYPNKHIALMDKITTSSGGPSTVPRAVVPVTPNPDLAELESDTSEDSTPPRQPYSKRNRHGPKEYDKVLSIVRKLPGARKIIPVPFARCPIVMFHHKPTGLHCDLSINNRYV